MREYDAKKKRWSGDFWIGSNGRYYKDKSIFGKVTTWRDEKDFGLIRATGEECKLRCPKGQLMFGMYSIKGNRRVVRVSILLREAHRFIL